MINPVHHDKWKETKGTIPLFLTSDFVSQFTCIPLFAYMLGVEEHIFGKYYSYISPNKPVQNFALKFPHYFHLYMKSAMSTSIFLSTARKKPSVKTDWLSCLGYPKTLAIYHDKSHGKFLSSLWCNALVNCIPNPQTPTDNGDFTKQ